MRVGVVSLSVMMVLGGCATGQQSASPVTSLETQITHQRFVVLPRPTPEAVDKDAARAAAALEAAERRQELVDEAIRPPRRPDLDETISSGLQGRNLGRALRR